MRAVKLQPCSHRDDEQHDAKHTPIIPSERTLTWNIDGELLEVQGEVLIRYTHTHIYVYMYIYICVCITRSVCVCVGMRAN